MDTLTDFLARHQRVALMFSAGKDSAACLKMLRPHLEHVMVIWVNPGHPYPETVQYMSAVQRSVPHFQMAMGHQQQFIRDHGHPADAVPFEATPLGRKATGQDAPALVPLEECCRANLWNPARRAVLDCRVTGCIRGDKACDHLHGDIHNGEVRDGVEFMFPLFDWTDQQVIDYLGDELPPSYARGLKTSLDCINCTAYLAENPGRFADLSQRHPEVWAEVRPIVFWMRDNARQHLAALEGQP